MTKQNYLVNILLRIHNVCYTRDDVRVWFSKKVFFRSRELGARKHAYKLDIGISSSTIHRFLKRLDLVPKQTNYRRPLFHNGKAMRSANTKGLGFLQASLAFQYFLTWFPFKVHYV